MFVVHRAASVVHGRARHAGPSAHAGRAADDGQGEAGRVCG